MFFFLFFFFDNFRLRVVSTMLHLCFTSHGEKCCASNYTNHTLPVTFSITSMSSIQPLIIRMWISLIFLLLLKSVRGSNFSTVCLCVYRSVNKIQTGVLSKIPMCIFFSVEIENCSELAPTIAVLVLSCQCSR